jgi:hypothetical protein
MGSFQELMNEYKSQMEKGTIKQAYQELMEFIMGLRSHFQKKYPDYYVSGNVYYGYMDMTYFSIIPDSFKQRKLKIAIVFNHDTCGFEVWLAAANKTIQTKYWKMVKESGGNKYRIPPSIKGYDSIIESILVDNPDYSNLEGLKQQIETGTSDFIKDMEEIIISK